MSEPKENIEYFEKYLYGDLEEEEKEAFEQKIIEDSSFHHDFELFKKAVLTIEVHAIGAEVKSILNKNQSNTWKWVGIAASLLLISVISFFYYSTKTKDPFKLYFEPYPNILAKRSTIDDKWLILEAYTEKDYLRSTKDLSSKGDLVHNDTANFYLGMSYLCLNRPGEAKKAFKLIGYQSIFAQQVTWYTALSNIALDSSSTAFNQLNSIGPSEFKFREAQELIDLIK